MTPELGGVETGGTWTVCAIGTGPGELSAREAFPTTTPGETLERIARFFEGRRPAAIGIGSFGPVDADPGSRTWGHVTSTPKPGWAHTPVAPVLRDRLGELPIAFDTDVTAAAVGEARWGAGRGAESLAYLTVGTGIGAGLLLDGRPLHGLVHPEVGHLRVAVDRARDPFPGICPFHGDCWEGMASGPAIAERWGCEPAELPDEHPAWELEAGYLAQGILALVLVASPHRVVAGGGVMERAGLLERVRERLRALNAGYLEHPLLGERVSEYLVAPELGDDAGVLGAIGLAHDALAGPGLRQKG